MPAEAPVDNAGSVEDVAQIISPSPPNPPKNKPSGPSVMQQIKSIMESLGKLPQDGCRNTFQAAADALQTHIAAADTVCIYACPGNIDGVVLVAGVGAGADMLLQQHVVMVGRVWSAVAVINQQPIGSSGCPPLSASISSGDEHSLEGLPQDWQLLAVGAGMRSFLTLELTAANGNPVGVVGLASRQKAAFDQQQCFDTMLGTACAGLASNLMLGHPLLLGTCELVAGLHADASAGFKAMAFNMLQGVQQLLLSVANVDVGVRIGILDRQTDVAIVLSTRQPRRRASASCDGSTSAGEQADYVLQMTRMPAAASLLHNTLAGRSPLFVPDATAASARAAPDLFIADEVVQSLVLVPFDAPDAAARCQAGMYITSAQPSNFAAVKAAVISIIGLLRPLLREGLLQEDAVAAMQQEAVQAAPVTPGPSPRPPSLDSSAGDTQSKVMPWTATMVQLLQEQVRDVASKATPSRDEDAFVQDLKLTKVLGAGGFGRVYLGSYQGCPAAIKVMHMPSGTQRSIMKSALEMAVQESMRHPNIVPVFKVLADMIEDVGTGISLEGAVPSTNCALLRYRPLQPEDPANAITCNVVVMELCDKGTLRQVFRTGILHSIAKTGPQGQLVVAAEMIKLLFVLLELASALEYIHERGIFHCDVKPENVLLRSSNNWPGWTCKLCDFGLVKMLGEDRLYMRNKSTSGTVTYIAPERFVPGTKLMPAVDVYAFGIMMYELYSRRSAFPPGTLPANFVSRVAQGERPQFPAGTPSRYARLAKACWAQDAAERPSAAAVAVELKEMMALVSRQSRG